MPRRISSVFKKNYIPEIPWSQRALNGKRSNLIKDIRGFLNLLSGFELTNLIKDLIKENEIQFIAEKFYKGLQNLSRPINTVKPKNKHYFYRELKLAHFNLNELKNMGYKISKKLWSSCKKTHKRLLGGKPKIPKD